uniref:glutaminase n=1 Tax=Strigamia maritima TaxID=126957 RepID=T1IPF4_STRMM
MSVSTHLASQLKNLRVVLRQPLSPKQIRKRQILNLNCLPPSCNTEFGASVPIRNAATSCACAAASLPSSPRRQFHEGTTFNKSHNKAGIIHPVDEFKVGDVAKEKKEDSDHESSSTNLHQHNVDDILFALFKNEENLVPVGKFLAALRATGLRKTDPRLRELMNNLKTVREQKFGEIGSAEALTLDKETFKSVILENIVLISRAFRGQFVVPDFTNFCKYIEEFYWKCKSNHAGKVANYIPQLDRFSPDYWGVSLCTVDGQRYSIGDIEVPFTVQSCSKPLTYAIALNEVGAEVVHKYVGQEPSGRMFNELILDYNKKPHNPMINAGAIIICSLLQRLVEPQMKVSDKFDFVTNYFKRLTGYEFLGFNNSTFLSERDAADRNYALGFYMREHKCFPEKCNLRETMDFYFQLCALEANCESMSVIAATLANGGICPTTGEKVFQTHAVRDVLSLMHSCGMYDYSGQFAFKVT